MKHPPTATVEYGRDAAPEHFPPGSNSWKVTLRFRGRRLTVPFYTGPAIEREPEAKEVLDCLLYDLSAGDQSFEDFCGDFGYDIDSRKAEATWKACAAMSPRVVRFCGEEFSELCEWVQS